MCNRATVDDCDGSLDYINIALILKQKKKKKKSTNVQ